jgi:uncharacterized protein (TIGR02246 family)
MSTRWLCAAAVAAAAAGVSITAHSQTRTPAGQGGEADVEEIRQSARDFVAAFNKGDAKVVAAMWTENGECRDPDGRTFVGRAAIEKAFAESFAANPGAKVEVLVRSVRFPAKDLAVEEGLLRLARGPKDLPSTTTYVTVHAREAGQWKVALSSEAGAGQDRLEDLEWLLGTWAMKGKGEEISLSFAHDPKKPVMTATFTRTAAGKDPVTGTIRIGLDPETGRLRSWAFEDDGGHSQALWLCDGKSWLLDTRGVLADGTPTQEVIVLQRVAADAIAWRSIDRVLGDTPLPDTNPVRLTRAASK